MQEKIYLNITQRGNFIVSGGRWQDVITTDYNKARKCKEARERQIIRQNVSKRRPDNLH